MARFDVYRFAAKAAPLVVDVQADLLEDLASRVVVPLVPVRNAGREALPQLKPRIVVEGKDYILMTTDIAALPRARLGPRIGNIEAEHRDDIVNALDFLFVGF
jgi:toxin CcdB